MELNSAIDWLDLVICIPILVLLDAVLLVFGVAHTIIQLASLFSGTAA
jgi:hypothetical protein